jgi:hypothetical protein
VEYQSGFKTCFDCGADLADELAPLAESAGEGDAYAGDAYLMSAADSVEAAIIESFLNVDGIPVLKKYRAAGGFLEIYMGQTVFGIDLYVPADKLEEAGDIVRNSRETGGESRLPRYCRAYGIRRRRKVAMLLVIMLLFWDFSSFL